MLAAILPANAQPVIGRFDVPPAEYDHPYSGKLVVVRVSKRDLLQFLCTNDKVLDSQGPRVCNAKGCRPILACAMHTTKDCMVIFGPGSWTNEGIDQRAWRHEIGHCNGWPGDHPGARK